jgi:hypothetical protein
MRPLMPMAIAMLAASTALSQAQATGAAQTAVTTQAPSAPSAEPPPLADGLSDLNAMTFGCPKAALNAAAREAAKVPSQGTYQFAYFSIISDSHHAAYEVHFKSNYAGEKDLRYGVSLYCQQGWDPRTAKTTVTLMSEKRRAPKAAGH